LKRLEENEDGYLTMESIDDEIAFCTDFNIIPLHISLSAWKKYVTAFNEKPNHPVTYRLYQKSFKRLLKFKIECLNWLAKEGFIDKIWKKTLHISGSYRKARCYQLNPKHKLILNITFEE